MYGFIHVANYKKSLNNIIEEAFIYDVEET
jgi:hypothetical protein